MSTPPAGASTGQLNGGRPTRPRRGIIDNRGLRLRFEPTPAMNTAHRKPLPGTRLDYFDAREAVDQPGQSA